MIMTVRILWLLAVSILFRWQKCHSFSSWTINSFRHHYQQRHSATSLKDTAKPPQVICIGDALYDCIANNDARGWTVDQLMKSEPNPWTAFPGGAPVNVACACRKLGTTSAFVGCLGNDQDGDDFLTLLKESQVNIQLVQRTDEEPTRRVIVTRSPAGDRNFGGFIDYRKAYQFADAYLDSTQLLSQADELLDNNPNGIIVSSTLSLAFPLSAKAVQTFVQRGIELGLKLFVDVNWRPVFWTTCSEEEARESIFDFCQQATIVKLTDEEAVWLFENDNIISSPTEALNHPERIHEQFPNAEIVLVTAGEYGAAYSMWNGCIGKIPPMQVDVVETTGAGDAFSAGFLYQYLNLDLQHVTTTMSLEERRQLAHDMVQCASVVGALTCTKEGAIAAQPSLQEVETYLSSLKQKTAS